MLLFLIRFNNKFIISYKKSNITNNVKTKLLLVKNFKKRQTRRSDVLPTHEFGNL